ncbi:hypothetical protein MNBD_GAMMA16-202 [hydrothermal vent metagenome]|uniref:Fungal lipase-type domain-containing protein n=1 Tax=hydrothermal vent metagenome TaxID=652676 RepID=A0A3B0YX56_9ZZZZ
MNYERLLVLLLFCILMSSCVSPAQKIDNHAFKYGLDRLELSGSLFTHISYGNTKKNKVKRLHIYIEGDGIAWFTRTRIATDPTPSKSLMLDLMSLDQQNSLYLGRPCYFGQAQSPFCHPLIWTHQRYSQEVVFSMVAALKKYMSLHPANELVFFGHSGGGTLAMLIAPYFDETVTVVTLAANLDITAWADHHGYTRLEGSLNPATMPPLPPHITQIHYAGENDSVVPAFIIKASSEKQINSQFRILKGVDHICCWDRIWKNLLNEHQMK